MSGSTHLIGKTLERRRVLGGDARAQHVRVTATTRLPAGLVGIACAVLVVIPPEVPVDPPSTNEDHLRQESQQRSILAVAVVAESTAVNAATNFDFGS